MKTAIIVLSIIVLVLAGSTYHLYGNKNELALKVDTLEQENDAIAGKLEAKITDISRKKEEEIARVAKVCDVLVRDMREEVEQGQVKITQLADRLSVVMVDKVLFPSGDAEITSDGLDVLERVGKALKDTQDRITADSAAIAGKIPDQLGALHRPGYERRAFFAGECRD